MTREQATQNIDEIDFLTWQIDIIEDMLDQIFNDHEAQLKAKDEKLQQLDDAYASVVSDFESAVIEIERLKDKHIVQICGFDKRSDSTARSIVAMLFWDYKKARSDRTSSAKQDENKYKLFQKAYAILKEQ